MDVVKTAASQWGDCMRGAFNRPRCRILKWESACTSAVQAHVTATHRAPALAWGTRAVLLVHVCPASPPPPLLHRPRNALRNRELPLAGPSRFRWLSDQFPISSRERLTRSNRIQQLHLGAFFLAGSDGRKWETETHASIWAVMS